MNQISIFDQVDIIGILFLILSSLFTVGYIVYSFVFFQRLKKLNITYSSPQNRHLFVLAFVQIFIAALLASYILIFFLFRAPK